MIRLLRSLPHFQPDPYWKAEAKERLLQAYDGWYGRVNALRQWAVYVSAGPDPSPVADVIVAKGHGWRPVAVCPERLDDAIHAIKPSLVVVDSRLAYCQRVVEEVKCRTAVSVLTDSELMGGRAA